MKSQDCRETECDFVNALRPRSRYEIEKVHRRELKQVRETLSPVGRRRSEFIKVNSSTHIRFHNYTVRRMKQTINYSTNYSLRVVGIREIDFHIRVYTSSLKKKKIVE